MNDKLFALIKQSKGVKDERKLVHAMKLLQETVEVANRISLLEENKESFESLSSEMQDNGDPGYLLEDGIYKSCLALVAAVEYFYEYFQEAFGIDSESKND